ncbi:MAG: ABC transporter permease [Anaerolineales bacterium]|nr:ABC transporter permease [Anaerolineales bacterium]
MMATWRRIWSLSIKEFIHLRSDWWLPAFMILGGALELLLIGWATSRPISNLPLMVLDHDRSAASRTFVVSLENTEIFNMEAEVYDDAAIEDALRLGEINAAVIIPPDFSSELSSATGRPIVAVLLNGAESIPATAALRAIEGVTREMGDQILVQRLGLQQEEFEGFIPSLRVWFNESLSEALYTIPAELGLMMEFTVLLFAALSFTRERELGTLEHLLVMPFSTLELVIGKSIPVVLVGFIDFGLMLGITHWAFGVPVSGSLSLLLVLAFVYILVELCKGLMISVVAKTQHQAFLLVLMVGMADFMFTGYAAPVESMPQVIQWVANFIPAHHFLAIVRGILLKGTGMEVLWPHVLALIVLGLFIGGFSMRFVRRSLS